MGRSVLLPVLATCLLSVPTVAGRPNVLLITIDTLRADHVSCYGYHLRTTPNIDRLAAQGTRFERAYTTIPLTGPAHFSLFTSRYPQEHGARINGVAHSEEARLIFLPQVLRKFGYHNAAFISAWPLTSRLTRLDRYFDLYDEELNRTYQLFNSSRFAEDVTPRAIAWLRAGARQPFFLWVHYFDPHSPYHFRKAFSRPARIGKVPPSALPSDEETRFRVASYDSEVAYTDHYVGRLLEALDELKLEKSTVVVLLSDHGESLGEHGYIGHGRHLYENIVRIPLIFRWPGVVQAGKTVASDVSLLDVAPTILELAAGSVQELPIPMGGRSLATSLYEGGAPPEERVIRHITFGGKKGFFPRWFSFLWTSVDERPLRVGMLAGSRKLIWSPQDESLEIFNLTRDPLEQAPVKPGRKSPLYQAETARLDQWFESTAGAAGANRMTEKDLETLRSLGYLQ